MLRMNRVTTSIFEIILNKSIKNIFVSNDWILQSAKPKTQPSASISRYTKKKTKHCCVAGLEPEQRTFDEQIKSSGMPNVFNTVCYFSIPKKLALHFKNRSIDGYRCFKGLSSYSLSHTHIQLLWEVVKYSEFECKIAFV